MKSGGTFANNKLQFVSPKEIENVVKSLQTKESHEYDEIPTKVIKQSNSYYHPQWPIYVI